MLPMLGFFWAVEVFEGLENKALLFMLPMLGFFWAFVVFEGLENTGQSS